MRRAEPLDPETVAALEAIDATLHGEPVDPDLADLAELSLILRDDRSEPDPAFLARLDGQVAARFAPGAPSPSSAPSRPSRRPPARGLWWGAGTALAGAVAIVLVVVLGGHLGGGSSSSAVHASSAGVGTSTVSSSSSAAAAPGAATGSTGSASGAAATSAQRTAKVPAGAPAPRGSRGRDVTQSARLALRARAGGVDRVAQQVFDVVGAEHGFVDSSHVVARAHGDSSARFSLSVPSGRLQATMTRLSSLPGATVASRTDSSADITGGVNAAAARLATARALHRSLLRQLADAVTTTEVDNLQAALRRNQATIVADTRAVATLHAKVTDSAIAVTVTAAPTGGGRAHGAGSGSGGFTIGRALHDAGDVLVVAAGVALIALAVLVPLAVLVAIGAWAWALTLRRRREGALGQ